MRNDYLVAEEVDVVEEVVDEEIADEVVMVEIAGIDDVVEVELGGINGSQREASVAVLEGARRAMML